MLIKNVQIVNEGKIIQSDLRIKNAFIEKIGKDLTALPNEKIIDGKGKYLLPGAIDDQVHFREPGLTHKATIATESRAAVAGGITSFMEMPNTVPNTLTQELLADKYLIASKTSVANYSFFMGASNDNIEEVLKTDPSNVCGVKIFMGSSTGNMLVDNESVLEGIFSKTPMLIATHCEDEATIRHNTEIYREKYGEKVPFSAHPKIRSAEACYISSSFAVNLAKKHGSRLHILHISTAKELELFEIKPLSEKRITAEACIHHLWFDDRSYEEKGAFIKWNPAVKSKADKEAIIEAVKSGKIDVIATDHAPHTFEEKSGSYFQAPSGGPLVQHAIPAMLEYVKKGIFDLPLVVNKMSHQPAKLFEIDRRGFIREGYYADLVLVNPNVSTKVTKENILYQCGWSPFEGTTFSHTIENTWVNGHMVWDNGQIIDDKMGERLLFTR